MSQILRRMDNGFSEVQAIWPEATVVLMAGGPSLSDEQIWAVEEAGEIQNIKVIVVNDAYLVAPWADVCYFADSHWHAWHTAGIARPSLGFSAADVRERFAAFHGQKCTIQNSGANIKDAAVHMLRNINYPNHSTGLSLDPKALCTGRNSGFQALNLAVLAGAKYIILLGYDGKPGDDGRAHWFGDHPRPTPPAIYPLLKQAMSAAELALKNIGVIVVNCSPGSAIDSFPKMDIRQALERF